MPSYRSIWRPISAGLSWLEGLPWLARQTLWALIFAPIIGGSVASFLDGGVGSALTHWRWSVLTSLVAETVLWLVLIERARLRLAHQAVSVPSSPRARVRDSLPAPEWQIGPLLFVDTGMNYVGRLDDPIPEYQCAEHRMQVRYNTGYEIRPLQLGDWLGGNGRDVWCEAGSHFLDFEGTVKHTQLRNLAERAAPMIIAERRKRKKPPA